MHISQCSIILIVLYLLRKVLPSSFKRNTRLFLPIEILCEIVAYHDRKSMANIQQASRLFRHLIDKYFPKYPLYKPKVQWIFYDEELKEFYDNKYHPYHPHRYEFRWGPPIYINLRSLIG